LWGIGIGGGSYSTGGIFSITPGGTYTTAYSFPSLTNYMSGASINVPLTLGSDGNLYGVNQSFGIGPVYEGQAFQYNPTASIFTLLYNWPSVNPSFPASPSGPLLQDPSSLIFYGLTLMGGASNDGDLYELTVSE
jgi:hypothetical protein